METDVILAHIKERDWLKPYASKILKAADEGKNYTPAEDSYMDSTMSLLGLD